MTEWDRLLRENGAVPSPPCGAQPSHEPEGGPRASRSPPRFLKKSRRKWHWIAKSSQSADTFRTLVPSSHSPPGKTPTGRNRRGPFWVPRVYFSQSSATFAYQKRGKPIDRTSTRLPPRQTPLCRRGPQTPRIPVRSRMLVGRLAKAARRPPLQDHPAIQGTGRIPQGAVWQCLFPTLPAAYGSRCRHGSAGSRGSRSRAQSSCAGWP